MLIILFNEVLEEQVCIKEPEDEVGDLEIPGDGFGSFLIIDRYIHPVLEMDSAEP